MTTAAVATLAATATLAAEIEIEIAEKLRTRPSVGPCSPGVVVVTLDPGFGLDDWTFCSADLLSEHLRADVEPIRAIRLADSRWTPAATLHAWRLASHFGHGWGQHTRCPVTGAMAPIARFRPDGGLDMLSTLQAVDGVEGARPPGAIAGKLPTLDHTTTTGRVRWSIHVDGQVDVEVRRPGKTVLEATIYPPDVPEEGDVPAYLCLDGRVVVDRPVGVDEVEVRHVVALLEVIRAACAVPLAPRDGRGLPPVSCMGVDFEWPLAAFEHLFGPAMEAVSGLIWEQAAREWLRRIDDAVDAADAQCPA